MSPAAYDRVKTVFLEALEQPPSERQAFVVPTLVAGAWVLLLLLRLPVVVILLVYSWLVGPWPGEQ